MFTGHKEHCLDRLLNTQFTGFDGSPWIRLPYTKMDVPKKSYVMEHQVTPESSEYLLGSDPLGWDQ